MITQSADRRGSTSSQTPRAPTRPNFAPLFTSSPPPQEFQLSLMAIQHSPPPTRPASPREPSQPSRRRPASCRGRRAIHAAALLIARAPAPKFRLEPVPIVDNVYTHFDLINRRKGRSRTQTPDNLPLCTATECPVKCVHHQGIYLHGGKGRTEMHERWGESNPGPEVWEAWAKEVFETASEGDRKVVRRFVEFHYVEGV